MVYTLENLCALSLPHQQTLIHCNAFKLAHPQLYAYTHTALKTHTLKSHANTDCITHTQNFQRKQ